MTKEMSALVTGANKGIGREIAGQLAERGYFIWVASRDAERGAAAAAQIQASGGQAQFVLLDVTDQGLITRAVKEVEARTPSLDVLVNNAGVSLGGFASPDKLDIEMMRDTYDVNVFGAVRVTQAFLPLIR